MTINGTDILRQSFFWPANPAEQLLTTEQWEQVRDAAGLTNREQEVTELLFNGGTRREIAQQLGMKPSTVRHHAEQIHSKLQVTNRVGVGSA